MVPEKVAVTLEFADSNFPHEVDKNKRWTGNVSPGREYHRSNIGLTQLVSWRIRRSEGTITLETMIENHYESIHHEPIR